MTCDANFGNVVLLLHFDGTNGQTTTTDSSSLANTVSLLAGAASLSTSSPKFGTACFDYNGSGSAFGNNACSVPITLGTALDIFTGAEWTIEGWLRVPTAGSTPTIFNYGGDAHTPDYVDFTLVAADNNNGTTSIQVTDQLMFGTVHSIAGTITTASNLWHHFAVVLHAGVASLYVDGVSQGTLTGVWGPSVYVNTNANPTVCLGNAVRSVTNAAVFIDEFRVSNIARYTANFTPSLVAFPNVACPVSIPSVTGLTVAAAEAALTAAGFVVGATIPVKSSTPPGLVVSSSPTGTAAPGATINLNVSAAGVIPAFLNDEAIGGAFFAGLLNLVEFVYMPERQPFLEGATNLILNRYKQEPGDVRQRGVDYTYFMVPGEIIQSVTVLGISAQGVLQADTDPVVTPLVVSSVIIDPAGQKFAYSVSGGQDGVEYTVQFETVTQIQSSNVEEIFSINVLVEDSFP